MDRYSGALCLQVSARVQTSFPNVFPENRQASLPPFVTYLHTSVSFSQNAGNKSAGSSGRLQLARTNREIRTRGVRRQTKGRRHEARRYFFFMTSYACCLHVKCFISYLACLAGRDVNFADANSHKPLFYAGNLQPYRSERSDLNGAIQAAHSAAECRMVHPFFTSA